MGLFTRNRPPSRGFPLERDALPRRRDDETLDVPHDFAASVQVEEFSDTSASELMDLFRPEQRPAPKR